MEYTVTIAERTFHLSIQEVQGGLEVAVDGLRMIVDMVPIAASENYSMLLNGRSYDVQVLKNQDDYQVVLNQKRYRVMVESERSRLLKSLTADRERNEEDQEIKAAMPGLVVKVEVKEGDRVVPGDGLVIVEAMKMENELRASREGTVKHIFVHQGMTVDQGQTLVVIEQEPGDP